VSDLDFELDIDARTAGLADAVTELDELEKTFKSSKDELTVLEKSFADTDKSLEKLSEQLADTRIEMQRAMQAGDEKKFWKLAQSTDDLTKKEEALRKKSAELKTSIDAQKKSTQAAADAVGHARDAEKDHKDAGEANDKRTKAATALLDRYGGKLGGVAKNTMSAVDELGSLTQGLSAADAVAVGAVAGFALLAVGLLAVGAAFVAAAASVYKYAVEQANAKRNTEQTLRALTQSNDVANATAAAFERIGHDTGQSNDQLLQYSRGLTETRRQMGLAQVSSKDLDTVLRAAASTATALDDAGAGQSIIDQFNAGLMTADQLADRVDKKYGDVVKQKMLGLDQQMTRLERNLSAITSHFDVKPVLEGLSRMVDLTDKETASGKFLQDIFDTVFGKTSGSLVEDFFVGLERYIIKSEIVLTDSEIYFYKFKNAVEAMTDVDLGPLGNLHDRINDIVDVVSKGGTEAMKLTDTVSGIGVAMSFVAKTTSTAADGFDKLKTKLDPQEWSKLATDFIDGFVNGLDKGITRVEDKVKQIGGTAIKTMKSVLDSHSPSRVFEDIGLTIPQGLELGVDSGAQSLGQSIDALVQPPQLPQSTSAQGANANAGGPRFVIEHLEINGVKGAEDIGDKLDEALTAWWERRALQMGIDAETEPT